MSIYNWLSNTGSRIREDWALGLRESFHMLYTGAWRIAGSRLPLGTNVYEREWDILILLDGCRVDAIWELVDEFEFLKRGSYLVSLGSTSREWLAKTFTPEYRAEIKSTSYVTANPYSEEIFSPKEGNTNSPFNPANWESVAADTFARLEEVWRDGWDDSLGTVPPRVVTDRAIEIARNCTSERLIIHYMQPHQPFIGPHARDNKQTWKDGNCWRQLRRNEKDIDTVKTVYCENLRVVLEEVEVLLNNIEGKAVISSDHGNAFGEWGIYGHPNGFLHPAVKRVPWIETVAEDSGEYMPSSKESKETVSDLAMSTEDRLSSLGYL